MVGMCTSWSVLLLTKGGRAFDGDIMQYIMPLDHLQEVKLCAG